MHSLEALAARAGEQRWTLDQLDWTTPVDLGRPWLPAALFPLHGSELLARREFDREIIDVFVLRDAIHRNAECDDIGLSMPQLERAGKNGFAQRALQLCLTVDIATHVGERIRHARK